MTPIITVIPEPTNGVFCAGIVYSFSAECPNARTARWYVEAAPIGFDESQVEFSNSRSLQTDVIFGFPGEWAINIECCEPS